MDLYLINICQNIKFFSNYYKQTKRMGFFTLEQIKSTLAIKNKKRISLITPYKSTQLLVFYKDGSFEHIQLFQNKILHEGKFNFIVQKNIKTLFRPLNRYQQKKQNYTDLICLIGQKEGLTYFGILNIRSQKYKPYEAIFYQKIQDFETVNYHFIVSPYSKNSYLIQITLNVENGLMIKCFDFKQKAWLKDILYLGSKFLNYIFIDVPISLVQNDKRISVCLISNGQKSESMHIACISITQSHFQITNKNQVSVEDFFISQNQQNSAISQASSPKSSSIQFSLTKQIKYFRNFTILGGYINNSGFLFLIGNSLLFDTKQKRQNMWQPTCNYINFTNLLLNIQITNTFLSLKNFKIGRQIIVRQYLGQIQKDMVFIVQNQIKKSIHKLSPQRVLEKNMDYDSEIHSFDNYQINLNYRVLNDKNGFFSYQLVCEQFFQKIKDSPSLIKIQRLLKIPKKMFYKQILEQFCEYFKEQQNFLHAILNHL